MHNYSKIIVDTSNVFYRVAALHLKDLTKDNLNTYIKNNEIYKIYKSFIEKLLQSTTGEVCLLFDPLLSNGQMSERLRIKNGYKTNRDKKIPSNVLRVDVLQKLYSYYLLEPKKRLAIYHDDMYEADDFVEKLTEEGKCLLISTDEDFCRYLEEGRVDMLIKGLTITDENIFTANQFKEKYGFNPNITSVTFWKTMYGDVSDNIVGAFTHLNTKVTVLASEYMKELLVKMGEENPPIAEMKRKLFEGTGEFSRLKELLLFSNTQVSYEKMLTLMEDNFRVIESFIPRGSDIDVEKFRAKVIFKEEDKESKKFSLSKARY